MPIEAAKDGDESFVGGLLAREFVEARNSRFGQEEAVLVAQDDVVASRPVLIFLKFELAQIVVWLLAIAGLVLVKYWRNRNAPCQAVEPEMPVPDFMPSKLGCARTVTDPSETIASSCMCMAKA